MRQDIKELIDAMQRGWNKYPHNTNIGTKQKIGNKIGLCPVAHALIGVGVNVDDVEKNLFVARKYLPVLQHQKVLNCHGEQYSLDSMIIHLADNYNWTTPEVIEWLKSHLND